MELFNRDKLEGKVRSKVRAAFKTPRQAVSRRQPSWSRLRRELIANVQPVLESIQLDAIRQMFAVHGDGPAPKQAKPNAEQRAKDLADDLIAVSKRRWATLKRPLSGQDVAEWRRQNFGTERVELIAVTEVTIAHQTGEDIAWKYLKKQGVKLSGTWRVGQNPCEECLAMNGKTERVWRRKFPKGPPSPHPGCNCYIVHERQE